MIWRAPLHDGVLIHFTERHAREPAKVQAFGLECGKHAEMGDPHDGARIGLQQALGVHIADALQVADTHPMEWRPAPYEELGWRAGGAVRGRALQKLERRAPSEAMLVKLSSEMPEVCVDAAWQALGRTMAILIPDAALSNDRANAAPEGQPRGMMRAARKSMWPEIGEPSKPPWGLPPSDAAAS